MHLDRCLTCRNCETTCPSGVEFGRLIDIGRHLVDGRVARPARERGLRWLLREGLTSPLFGFALKAGRALRPLVPAALAARLPAAAPGSLRPAAAPQALPPPRAGMRRKVLLLAGCVQPAMAPNINAATMRVLAAGGLEGVVASGAGCCGAIRAHLSDAAGSLADARRNIDAWWPLMAAGELLAIVSNSSACALAIKDYGRALDGDVRYADKARAVSVLARDLCELLPQLTPVLAGRVAPGKRRLVFHPPCTLQHGQRLGGVVENQMRTLGFELTLPAESHLCCGSAGTYSILQPFLSGRLRERKLAALAASGAECIVSANIGCIHHLQSGTPLPVRHWVEILDEALSWPGPPPHALHPPVL